MESVTMEDNPEVSSFQGQMAARYRERLSMGFDFNTPQNDKGMSWDTVRESVGHTSAVTHDGAEKPEKYVESPGNSPVRLNKESPGGTIAVPPQYLLHNNEAGSTVNEMRTIANKLEKRSATSIGLCSERRRHRTSSRQRKSLLDDAEVCLPTSSSSCIEMNRDPPKPTHCKGRKRSPSPTRRSLDRHQEKQKLTREDRQHSREILLPYALVRKNSRSSSLRGSFQRTDSMLSKNSIEPEINHSSKDLAGKASEKISPSKELSPQEPLRTNLKDYVKRKKSKMEDVKYRVHKKDWGKRYQSPKPPNEKTSRPFSRLGTESVSGLPVVSELLVKRPSSRTLRNDKQTLNKHGETDRNLQEKLKLDEKRGTAMERYLHFLNRTTPPLQDASIEAIRRIEKLESLRNATEHREHGLEKRNLSYNKDSKTEMPAYEYTQAKRVSTGDRERTVTTSSRPPSRTGSSRYQMERNKNLFESPSEEIHGLLNLKEETPNNLFKQDLNLLEANRVTERERQTPQTPWRNPSRQGLKYRPTSRQATVSRDGPETPELDSSKQSNSCDSQKRQRNFSYDPGNEERCTHRSIDSGWKHEIRSISNPVRSKLSSSRKEKPQGIPTDSILTDAPLEFSSSPKAHLPHEASLLTKSDTADTDLIPLHLRRCSDIRLKSIGRSGMTSYSSGEVGRHDVASTNLVIRQKDPESRTSKTKNLIEESTDILPSYKPEIYSRKKSRSPSPVVNMAPENRLVLKEGMVQMPFAKHHDHRHRKVDQDQRLLHQQVELEPNGKKKEGEEGNFLLNRVSSERVESVVMREIDRSASPPPAKPDEQRRRDAGLPSEKRKVSPDAEELQFCGREKTPPCKPKEPRLEKSLLSGYHSMDSLNRQKAAATPDEELENSPMGPCHFGGAEDKLDVPEAMKVSPEKKKRKTERGKVLKKKKKKKRETGWDASPKEQRHDKPMKEERTKEKMKEKIKKPPEKQPEKTPTVEKFRPSRKDSVQSCQSGQQIDMQTTTHSRPFRTSSQRDHPSPKFQAEAAKPQARSPKVKAESPKAKLDSPKYKHDVPIAPRNERRDSLLTPSLMSHPRKKSPIPIVPKSRPVRRLTGEPTNDFPLQSYIPLLTDIDAPPLRKPDILVKYRRWREGLMDPEHPSRLPMSRTFKDTLDCAVVEEWALHCWQPETELYMDDTGTWWSCAKEDENSELIKASLLQPESLFSKNGLLDLGVRLPYMNFGPLRVTHATWFAFVCVCALIGKIGERMYKCNGDDFDYFCSDGDLACLVPLINAPRN